MSRSYYVIELSARWLTVLLVALAVVMVLAFGLGYGAAWSVLSGERANDDGLTALRAAATPTAIPEVLIPTALSGPQDELEPTPEPEPTATPEPEPTVPPTPRPTATQAVTDFFVQVLASSKLPTVDEARTKLEALGFRRDHQHLITIQNPGSPALYKLRIGPFIDRTSAERVSQRMSAAGFPDSWVVAP
jgi:cell division septation protein DedD